MIQRALRFLGTVVLLAAGVTLWAAFFDFPTRALMIPLTVHEDVRPSAVIVVLGSGTKKKDPDHLPLQAKERVLKGVELWDSGAAPAVIVAGGRDKKTQLVEADEMERYALAAGTAPSAIITERASRDTYENAKNSLAIMDAHQWNTALVVTSPYHTARACQIFRKQGGDVRCVVAPFYTTDQPKPLTRLNNFRSVLREYGAWAWNWSRGKV